MGDGNKAFSSWIMLPAEVKHQMQPDYSATSLQWFLKSHFDIYSASQELTFTKYGDKYIQFALGQLFPDILSTSVK